MAIFEPNDDQKLLIDSVEKFIERSYDDAARIKMGETPFDTGRWASMAELGWLMLPFQEADGGMQSEGRTGAGDIAALYESLGPGLVVEPLLETSILAGGLIAHSKGPARDPALIGGIASGESRAAAALHEPRARYDLLHCETKAEKSGGGWTLNGRKSMALGAPGADKLVILARAEGAPGDGGAGLVLLLAPADAAGVTLKPYRLRDDHWAADVELSNVSLPDGALLAGPGEAESVLSLVVDQTRLAMAAEMVGVAHRLTRDTVQYATVRSQFGVPIGTFQVLQHRMVDMGVGVETLRSHVYRAAGLAENGWTDEARAMARRAYASASETAAQIGKHAVQIHGGMGMTEEVPIGRLLRRVYALGLLFPGSLNQKKGEAVGFAPFLPKRADAARIGSAQNSLHEPCSAAAFGAACATAGFADVRSGSAGSSAGAEFASADRHSASFARSPERETRKEATSDRRRVASSDMLRARDALSSARAEFCCVI